MLSNQFAILINVRFKQIKPKTHLESKIFFSPIFLTFLYIFFSAKVVRRSAKFLATELIPYVQLLIKEHTDKEPNQIREIEKSFKDSFST